MCIRPSRLPRPSQELKGFRKVFLEPGRAQTVSIPLDRSTFAFFDPVRQGWLSEKGSFTVLVGSSSRDIRLQGPFRLGKTTLEKLPGATSQQPRAEARAGG